MNIALTGATGFVGRSLTRQLIDCGHQVHALSRSQQPEQPGVTWFCGDLSDSVTLRPWIRDCDAVVHAALARQDANFMAHPSDPVDYYRTNVVGTLVLIELAIEAKVARMINISSGAVHQRVLDDRPLDETHPLTPGSLYGAVKSATETLATAYGTSGRLAIANLRPVSIYGIEPDANTSKFADLIRQIHAGETIDISGGGKVVHVEDVAAAIRHLLDTDSDIAGETYHCCDSFVTHATIVAIAAELLQREIATKGTAKNDLHPITSGKLRDLGFEFGGTPRLRQTIAEMLQRG